MPDGSIVIEGRQYSKVVQNVLVMSNLPVDAITRQEFADNFRTALGLHIPLASLTTEYSIIGITFKYNASFPSFSVFTGFTAGDFVGTASGPATTQSAVLVSTSYAGPKPNRGRTYFGGNIKANLDATGRWTAATRDSRVDFITALRDGILWNGGAQVSQLRIARLNAQGTITFSNPVESVRGTTIPRTQKRRVVDVGS